MSVKEVNPKLLKTAEALGIDTKGKSESELMDAITKTWDQEKANIKESGKQESIDNGASKLPDLKKQFENPFEIWLEKVQNGKKPECLSVVGYNSKNSCVIVTKPVKATDGKITHKLFQVEEKLVITSLKQLTDSEAKSKAKSKK